MIRSGAERIQHVATYLMSGPWPRLFLLFLWGLSIPGLIHAQTGTADNLVLI